MLGGWLNNALAALPGTDDQLFRNLWAERRLSFGERHRVGDIVDESSARLVVAALRRCTRLLVVLPDLSPHRPALLFATGLIRYWWDSRYLSRHDPVLYFGSAVGIRDQLSRTTVSRMQMSLSDVFDQQNVSRGATGHGPNGQAALAEASSLPLVVTIYSPADPVGVVQAYKPSWVAIDCGDLPSLAWLPQLLDEAKRRGIPVVAWGQNSLSECVKDFRDRGLTFVWPPSLEHQDCIETSLDGDPETLLDTPSATALLPIVIESERVELFSKVLGESGKTLGRVVQNLGGHFVRDAVSVHYRYLRSLESLTVPIDFYEAEAPRFWGLRSFQELRSVCENFRNACERVASHLYGELEHIGGLLDEAKNSLEIQGCTLWEALAHLCIENPDPKEVRILVFSGESRKRLFVFAMLARNNISEDDLREMRTYVASLNELRQWMIYRHLSVETEVQEDFSMPPRDLTWHPVVVGLPSPTITPRLLPVFLHPRVDVLLYPHQYWSFMRRQTEWTFLMSANSAEIAKTVAWLGEILAPEIPQSRPTRTTVAGPIEINLKTAAKKEACSTGPLWEPDDLTNEVARLLGIDGQSSEEELVLTDQTQGDTSRALGAPEEMWCQEAIKVQFEHSWYAYFAPEDMINVVRVDTHGNHLDQRYVRSLRVGDRVVLIGGQKRQNLYDLIISRVHKHPSIELHLALIRRWQEDLRLAFQHWQTRIADSADARVYGSRDLNGLLRQMQARGSHLVSTLTLSLWLKGLVLCPLDPEDLRRVSEILDMGFVRQYHRRIVQAANRLRGLHRGLSLRLKGWLEDQAAGRVHRGDDDVIDAELGLTFGDVRSSLLVLSILEIEKVSGPFLRSNLGRAEREI